MMRSLLEKAALSIHDWVMRSAQRKREKRKEKWQVIFKTNWDARLPPVHSSGRYPLDVWRKADLSTQEQSSLFSLPLELRRLIYAYALGGEQLQFELVDEENEKAPFKLRCSAPQQLLAFPKSCKMAYVESLAYIYTGNTFRCPSTTAYFCLLRLVPTASFDTIQSIQLKWAHPETRNYDRYLEGHPPYNKWCWVQTFQEIAKMKGLKYLRVDMVLYAPFQQAFYEEILFEPMEVVKGVEMEVCVNWEECSDGVKEEDGGRVWPFTVRRGVKGLEKPLSEQGANSIAST